MNEKQRTDSTRKKIDKILFLLENDDETGRKGLYSDVQELKTKFYKFIREYEIKEARRNTKIKTWSFVGGGVVAAAFTLLKLILTKSL